MRAVGVPLNRMDPKHMILAPELICTCAPASTTNESDTEITSLIT